MTNGKMLEKQKRMREIEDRKIEIFLEIANINRDYNQQVTQLNYEYEGLHREHYQLQIDLISRKKYQYQQS